MAKKLPEQAETTPANVPSAEKKILDAYFHQGVTLYTGVNQRETIQHKSFYRYNEQGKLEQLEKGKYTARFSPQGVWIKVKGREEETLVPLANIRYITMV
jgi:hypothetical protein